MPQPPVGTPGAVIAAAELCWEAGTSKPAAYPLSGIITSGFGTQATNTSDKDTRHNNPNKRGRSSSSELIQFPREVKDAVMLSPGTCDAAVYAHTAPGAWASRSQPLSLTTPCWQCLRGATAPSGRRACACMS